jgi:hypothetical protein
MTAWAQFGYSGYGIPGTGWIKDLPGYGGAPAEFTPWITRTLTPYKVRVLFSDLLDLANPNLINPTTYWVGRVPYPPFIQHPVHSVAIETSNSVVLTVDYLDRPQYVLFFTQSLTSYFGTTLAQYGLWVDGMPRRGSYRPVPVAWRKVRVLFDSAMTVNAALTDPESYRVTTHLGTVLPISSVIAEGDPHAPIAVSLVLGEDLIDRGVHTAEVLSPDITDIFGSIVAGSKDFRWVAPALQSAVPFSKFTGEERGGLLGQHNGLVFFSPGLTTSAPNSSIQVDAVSVCTRAHDVYVFPNPPDPNVLFTYRRGQRTGSLSSAGFVTFARFDRLGGAKVDLHDVRQDVLAHPTDSHDTGTLVETLEPTRAPRLNAVAYHVAPPHKRPVWPLFDGVSTTPFATASNLTPIPPGTTKGPVAMADLGALV